MTPAGRRQPTAATGTSTLISEVARVDLRVTSIDRAVSFYRDIVGLEVAARDEQRASLRAPGGRVLVALDAGGVETGADRRATGLFHTAFLYPDRASLADALARVLAAGYPVGNGDHGVSEALYVDDPDGNGVELYRDRPRQEWPKPPPGARVGMYTAPVDLEGLLAESRTRARTAAPEDTAIGHVHFQISDLEDSLRFYVDGVGLDLMQSMGGSAAFLSSRGYHHHIGANIWNSRGGTAAPRRRAGLDRVVFRVENPEDLELARQRLAALGYETSGDSRELVVRDPDGIELRFAPPE
jgi:catechol 2,3-dioxygenase